MKYTEFKTDEEAKSTFLIELKRFDRALRWFTHSNNVECEPDSCPMDCKDSVGNGTLKRHTNLGIWSAVLHELASAICDCIMALEEDNWHVVIRLAWVRIEIVLSAFEWHKDFYPDHVRVLRTMYDSFTYYGYRFDPNSRILKHQFDYTEYLTDLNELEEKLSNLQETLENDYTDNHTVECYFVHHESHEFEIAQHKDVIKQRDEEVSELRKEILALKKKIDIATVKSA